MAITTITNSEVNSGASIDLQAYDLATTIDIFTTVRDKPLQPSGTFEERLPSGSYTGYSGPGHTVQGVYRLQDGAESGAEAAINYAFIKALALNADKTMTLVDDKLGTVTVRLMNYDDGRTSQESEDGDWISYTMVFKEVSA